MRGERVNVLHRVKGRPVLIRSARSLVLRVHRYGVARARTPAEIRWTARALDALDVALRVMEQPDETAAPASSAPRVTRDDGAEARS